MIYFRKDFNQSNDSTTYTVNDFIDEPDVRKALYKIKQQDDENNDIPVIAHIKVCWLSKQSDDSFLYKDKSVTLVIQTKIDINTKKIYRLYPSQVIYNHVKYLLDLIEPEDKLCYIELSDRK